MNHYADERRVYERQECRAKTGIAGAGMRAPVPTEQQIQRAILDYLAAVGIPAWRQNTGAMAGAHNGKSWYVRFGPKGQSDIQGVLPGSGRFLAIEVKRPKGKATPEQHAFLDRITEAGGVAFIAWSVEDCRIRLTQEGIMGKLGTR